MEEEKERRIILQEARKELWKRWMQMKGRGPLTLTNEASKAEKGCLEKKLEKTGRGGRKQRRSTGT